ncbi:diacylglycerol/lipid kinase family protein [Chitinophaga qingshengii]|uniref:Diacylglycerol kinase family lipid kinase n=1 Tax=Chitinophaga qingshengii TaxID=1569794 RepID=A0ABR7TSM4_9BACT|nr:diacylglycerol kinase family protein [Chitinophaga qingshengii]MBC9933481.1 diacylglycerol kinase family lipid kinase [Chitinophaga qingshengii]
MEKKLRLLFVINPASGAARKVAPQEVVQRFLAYHAGVMGELLLLTGHPADDDARLRQLLQQGGWNGVVAAGGDGTVKMVATCLLHTDIPLGILPAGSANGMARDLCIPESWEAALDLVLQAHVRKIDVIQINGREISIHLSDIGLNALLVKYFQQSGVRGMAGYARMVVKTFWYRQRFAVEIDNGADQVKREAFMIVLANAGKYGTGACINPVSDLSDGIFEVVLIKQLSLLETLKMLFIRRPFNPHKTEIIRARKVYIHTPKKAEFQIDGEYMGKVTTVAAEIIPRSLAVFVPAQGS